MDINDLFKPRLPEEDIPIEGIGTVKIRALNRLEALSIEKISGTEATERAILVMGMVDPPMTDADVKRWQAASAAGEIEHVSRRIAALSGMLPTSPKEAVREFEANPDTEFRALSSPETRDDSGAAPAGDVG